MCCSVGREWNSRALAGSRQEPVEDCLSQSGHAEGAGKRTLHSSAPSAEPHNDTVLDFIYQHRAMSSTYPVIDSRPVYPHIQTTCSSCHFQLEFPVPNPAPKPSQLLTVRCCSCKKTFSHAFYPNQVPTNASVATGSSKSHGQMPTPPPRKGRKIGTQERPLETGYYDLLGVPVDATTDDIKKAYRASIYYPFHT